MKTESITWHELPQDGMPDAEETVLISSATEVDQGWFDGVDWRLCESGGVADGVLAWAKLPEGMTC